MSDVRQAILSLTLRAGAVPVDYTPLRTIAQNCIEIRETIQTLAVSGTPTSHEITDYHGDTGNTTYRAAASTAMSAAGGNTGHGCFRGKDAVSFGLQAVGGGASVTIGGGEEYELVDMVVLDKDGQPVTDKEGKIVTQKVNPCAQDQVTLATIYNGTNGTPAQRAMAATTAVAASPAAARGLERVVADPKLVALFAEPAPAIECSEPTKPAFNLTQKKWTCQPH
jgi:hypothetical protein